MATASPTPMPSYGASRIGRKPSMRLQQRRDSPLSILGQSAGFSDSAPMLQNIGVGDDSSEDEAPQPLSLSKYAEEIIAHNAINSPEKNPGRQPKLRISRDRSDSGAPNGPVSMSASFPSATPAPAQDTITPAPSLRIKRVPLRGAPIRRLRRTPQSDEDHPPSQDQENVPGSALKNGSVNTGTPEPLKVGSMVRSLQKSEKVELQSPKPQPIPLGPRSANTPLRPAPPPPPKMSVLETLTADAGASTTKTRRKRQIITVNGKTFTQMGKMGKGGSADVHRVMAENMKLFALKRVKLEDADPTAIRGFKGEIDLLRKLQDCDRVVRLVDYEVDDTKQVLMVVSSYTFNSGLYDEYYHASSLQDARLALM
jgi:serine/threonine-protein kinase TTK/MPS1